MCLVFTECVVGLVEGFHFVTQWQLEPVLLISHRCQVDPRDLAVEPVSIGGSHPLKAPPPAKVQLAPVVAVIRLTVALVEGGVGLASEFWNNAMEWHPTD